MNFKSARIKAHLTQEEAAKKIGVHQTAIAAWENGRAMPRAAKFLRVCEVYGCTAEDLLNNNPEEAAV